VLFVNEFDVVVVFGAGLFLACEGRFLKKNRKIIFEINFKKNKFNEKS